MKTISLKMILLALLISSNALAQWGSYSLPEQFFPSNVIKKVGTRLWCGGNHGIYVSDNNGYTWSKSYNGPLCTSSSAFRKIYNSGSTVWVAMDDGFFATLLVTRDNGLTWQEDTISDHIYTRNYNGYYSVSIIKDTIYAQTSQSGFPTTQHSWKKHVNDTMWIEYNGIEYQSGMVSAPYACYPGNGIWFVDFGNFYSTIDGQTFTPITITPSMAVHYMTVFNNKLFVSGIEGATTDSISCISNDNGVTWNKITTLAPSTKITFLAANGNEIVATDNLGRTHISQDNAATWTLQTGPTLAFTSLEQIGGQFLCTLFTKDSVYKWGNSTGLNTIQTAPLKIYPNPATDQIHVSIPAELLNCSFEVSIINMLGQTMQHMHVNQAQSIEKITLHSMPKGLYSVQLNYSNHHYASSLLIQ